MYSGDELLSVSRYPTAVRRMLQHVGPEEIPLSEDLMSAKTLEEYLLCLADPPLSFIVAGDIMLGGRAKKIIGAQGEGYSFAAVRPLLRQAPIVLGNLEGPLARKAPKVQRHHSYRVHPRRARALAQAGITMVTLANNHLLDCGREGVEETLSTLAHIGVLSVGAGENTTAAHAPVISRASGWVIGFLAYYWNRRTAATAHLPGSALDSPDSFAADIQKLRTRVDRIIVTFHWGEPYQRDPAPEDRAKAHFAIDCGADIVVGHHAHVIQPFEVYRGRPIFYGVGNFAFGSGNSRAEGLLVGVRFVQTRTIVHLYPLYVKNRDPRVAYQPKVMTGAAAERILCALRAMSGPSAALLNIEHCRGSLELPWMNLPSDDSGENDV